MAHIGLLVGVFKISVEYAGRPENHGPYRCRKVMLVGSLLVHGA